MKSINTLFLALFFFAATSMASCGDSIQPTVLDIVAGSPNHRYLTKIVLALDLDGPLRDSADLTVFAPDDRAFRQVMRDLGVPTWLPISWQVRIALHAIPGGANTLTEVVLNHVVGTSVCSSDIPSGKDNAAELFPLGGTSLFGWIENGAFVRTECSLADIKVVDLSADNGVVHSIGKVLFPGDQDFYCPDEEVEPCYPDSGATKTLLDIVADSPDHNILEAVVGALGLADTVANAQDVTLFAPTDAAFQKLFAALGVEGDPLTWLVENVGVDALRWVVLNHVATAPICSQAILDANPTGDNPLGPVDTAGATQDPATTPLYAFINDGMVYVKTGCTKVRVSAFDLVASNGVLHVVDDVIFPGGQDLYCPDKPGVCSDKVYGETVWDVIKDSRRHSILERIIVALGLGGALREAEEVTVLAPDNWAFWVLFKRLNVPRFRSLDYKIQWLVNNVPGGADTLRTVVLNHVFGAAVCSADAVDGSPYEPLAGTEVEIYNSKWGTVKAKTECTWASIKSFDLSAGNGVVHSITQVLFPGGQDIYCPRQKN